MTNPTPRPIWRIGQDIVDDFRANGKPMYFGAVPYVEAMLSLESLTDFYGADSAQSILLYALSNLTSWRGEKAREIKAEIKSLLKRK